MIEQLDPILLARIQFAFTVSFHILFLAFTIELANDCRGYLPTPRQHALGGYETWMGTSRVQLDASEKISKIVLELMRQLKDQQ